MPHSRVVFRRLVWELAWLLAMSKSSRDWPMRQVQRLSRLTLIRIDTSVLSEKVFPLLICDSIVRSVPDLPRFLFKRVIFLDNTHLPVSGRYNDRLVLLVGHDSVEQYPEIQAFLLFEKVCLVCVNGVLPCH